MEAERHSQPKLSIGITSIVVIFSSLCLTIFAVLALSTADNERALSQKQADSVSDYYAADRLCAVAANSIGELWDSGADFTALSRLANELGGQLRRDDDAAYFTYSADVDATRRLETEIRLDDNFTVLRWQTVSVGDWTPDDSLPVWTGELQEAAG